jgi:hypothetical protein
MEGASPARRAEIANPLDERQQRLASPIAFLAGNERRFVAHHQQDSVVGR